MAFAWIFFRDFSHVFERSLWGKLFIGNIQYFTVQIFPIVWPASITTTTTTLFLKTVTMSPCNTDEISETTFYKKIKKKLKRNKSARNTLQAG